MSEMYPARIAPPKIAYLKRNNFREEFRNNDLMSDWAYTSISQIAYVGPFGATETLPQTFACQQALCVCRQMMRYVRGWGQIYLGNEREPAKAKLRLNMVELQRDILKTRREDIKRDDQLFRDRPGELEDVRRQISIIDRKWARVR